LAAEKVEVRSPILVDEHESRKFGTAWLKERRSAILLVPSVIVSVENNVLINPEHPDAGKIKVISATPFLFDKRLF
jgi:RES domain-containing protein